MAEPTPTDRPEKNKASWLWLLLAVIAIGLLIWWIFADSRDVDSNIVEPVESEEIAEILPEEEAAMDEPMAGVMTAEGAALSEILASPDEYVGMDDFSGSVDVPEVPTDRGFWMAQDGARMFALIIDNPQEEPKDINPGQSLSITDGMIRDAGYVGSLPGDSLDQDTRAIIDDQKVVLVVDERNIEIN